MNGFPESPRSESARSVSRHISTPPGKEKLTQARVKTLLDYRAKDGRLVWRVGHPRVKAGTTAGAVKKKTGYAYIGVGHVKYAAHRLVWFWHHGYFPENDIDHINRDRSDNRIENLREVTRSCNSRNSPPRTDNTSGVKGVNWFSPGGKWRAVITDNGKRTTVCLSGCFTEAVCHRLAAEQALGWAGCDNSSPAYQYVKKHIQGIK